MTAGLRPPGPELDEPATVPFPATVLAPAGAAPVVVDHSPPDPAELPPPGPRWRTMWKTARFRHHNRLVALVLLVNAVVAVHGVRAGWWTAERVEVAALSDVVLADIALAVLIRQQYVVNLLFRLATLPPTSWPLRIRWTLAKVFHFGGLHIGGLGVRRAHVRGQPVRVEQVATGALGRRLREICVAEKPRQQFRQDLAAGGP